MFQQNRLQSKKDDLNLKLDNTNMKIEFEMRLLKPVEDIGDVNDIFGKNNSQRQFYTVPGNQVPNDQGSFAQWCYGQPKTCKEGNKLACLSNLGNSGGVV